MVLKLPAGLSKEACLYAGADWQSLSVSQKAARGQYLNTLPRWGTVKAEIEVPPAAGSVENPDSLKSSPFTKPTVGQNIALCASITARNSKRLPLSFLA